MIDEQWRGRVELIECSTYSLTDSVTKTIAFSHGIEYKTPVETPEDGSPPTHTVLRGVPDTPK